MENETPGFDEYFDHKMWMNVTTLNRYDRCPRLAFYSSGCGLQKPEEQKALKFGEAMHNAIPEVSTGEVTTRIQRALNRFSSIWTPAHDVYFDDPARNTSRAHLMLQDFQYTHTDERALYELVHPKDLGLNTQFLDVSDRVSEYEIPFIVDIGLDIPLVGRIDGIGRMRDTGEYCLLEYKTSSKLWNFFERFELSPQVLLYNLGASAQLSDLRITKCIVEVLEVSKTKCSSTSMPINIQEHHVQEALESARRTTMRFLDDVKRKNFPKQFSGCHAYAMFGEGGYVCEYMDLCKPPQWTQNVGLFVKKPDTRYEILFPTGEKVTVDRD